MTTAFDDLRHTLDALHAENKTLRFWLRDDDATVPTPALDQLAQVTSDNSVPCLLAIIPAHTRQPLADWLAQFGHMSVSVHGWAHENHAAKGEKKRELGLHRGLDNVLAELSQGLGVLQDLHGARCLPLLVPPWNRIDAGVVAALPAIGFAGLSTFGSEQAAALVTLNTHVDLIDWHGTRGGREDLALVADLKTAIQNGVLDIGFLTHHLVHDAKAWDFLARFLALTSRHPACIWRSAGEILHERVLRAGLIV